MFIVWTYQDRDVAGYVYDSKEQSDNDPTSYTRVISSAELIKEFMGTKGYDHETECEIVYE